MSFLPELKKLGYDYVDVKGLRYNHETMSKWMPIESQKYYIGTEEKEILPDDGWREKVIAAGLQLKTLKQWHREKPVLGPHLNRVEAEKRVKKLLQYANITSLNTDEAVK